MTFRRRAGDAEGQPKERQSAGSSRATLMTVGLVVVLIAVIALVNRGGSGPQQDAQDGRPGADSTAPTGTKPIEDPGKVPTTFPASKQGVESAAANYAVALGSKGMFTTASRHQIVEAVSTHDAVDDLQPKYDASYTALAKKLGLDKDGKASKGSHFVTRTVPVGTKTSAYAGGSATVRVWCVGMFGIAGEGSTEPVTDYWFTMTMHLKREDSGWRIVKSSQKDGPAPRPGDTKASGPDEIRKAAEDYHDLIHSR